MEIISRLIEIDRRAHIHSENDDDDNDEHRIKRVIEWKIYKIHAVIQNEYYNGIKRTQGLF